MHVLAFKTLALPLSLETSRAEDDFKTITGTTHPFEFQR